MGDHTISTVDGAKTTAIENAIKAIGGLPTDADGAIVENDGTTKVTDAVLIAHWLAEQLVKLERRHDESTRKQAVTPRRDDGATPKTR